MMGLPERTIVMSCEDAKDYVDAKIETLCNRKDALLTELNNIDREIDQEMEKLYMLNNPPQKEFIPVIEAPSANNSHNIFEAIINKITK